MPDTGVAARFVGAKVRRLEDPRLLTGRGQYVDDVTAPAMLHAAFVRSPHPHATIVNVDVSAARRLPGVHLVLTGEEIKQLTHPFMGMAAMEGFYDPVFYALATDRVRLVGDPVAIVVAESRRVAEDACEMVDVEYELLPAVASIEQAVDPSRPPIWPRAGGNVLWEDSTSYGEVDACFAEADRVITETFVEHRISNQPMETRGSVAAIDPVTGALTFHAATQTAHALKWSLAFLTDRRPVWESIRWLASNRERPKKFFAGVRAFMAEHPDAMKAQQASTPATIKQIAREPARILHLGRAVIGLLAKSAERLPQVVAGDIGGAFGCKGLTSREDVALAAAALKLRRSVKWIEDRNEHLLVGGQARDEEVRISAAVNNDGTVLALKVHATLDMGAYPGFPYASPMILQLVRAMMPGPYRIRALQFDSRLTASNKATYVPYRGPWAVEVWSRERMLDVIARELGLSRAEIRAKNMIRPDELPTAMVTGPPLDVRMSAYTTLTRALEIAGFDGWPAEQERARAEGKILGLGLATYIEAAPGPPGFFDYVTPGMGALLGNEGARAVLERDGSLTVHTSQVPHGQGHETTLAQVAADKLGVAPDAIRVQYGDTRESPFSLMGTGGSRSAAMAGGSVGRAAGGLHAEAVRLAADLLEAAPGDVVVEEGRFHVKGVPAISVGYPEVAAEVMRSGREGPEALRITSEWDGGEGGWSQATHVCWVEVDLETGLVRIPRYLVVEDCGELINPAIVDGQIRGGVAQGIGAVLYEKAAYNEDGVFQAGTFMDYLIPTMMEIPSIEIVHVQTPSDIEANYRGVGEGGMIAAPAALTSAIEDALAHRGVRVTEEYLPPYRILELAGVIPQDG
jgi:carbon-monoxide dehydrogenase large subunit